MHSEICPLTHELQCMSITVQIVRNKCLVSERTIYQWVKWKADLLSHRCWKIILHQLGIDCRTSCYFVKYDQIL